MSDTASVDTARALGGILSEGRIPDHLRPGAEALISRLTKPVRVTVFGFPGSGKSTLVNLLLGSPVLQVGDRLPTVRIAWGDAPKSRCTLADGSIAEFPHFDTAEIAAKAPIFVEAELPLPALGKISVMEVVAHTADDVRRAVQWAASRTDIALWCTQKFNSPEQALWSAAADDLKDHGFLVVTKADELVAMDVLDETLAAVQERGGEEFNRVFPIATLDAIAARRNDGSIDKDQLTRSGGRALIAAILREVNLGQQAARDQADILLQQFGGGSPGPTEEVKSETAEEPAAGDHGEAAAMPEFAEGAEQQPTAEEDAPVPEMETAPAGGLGPATRSAYSEAIGRLSRHARQASDGIKTAGVLDAGQLLEETVDTVQWLSDLLAEKAATDSAVERLRDAAYDASDLLQLMQLENDGNAVKEAISIAIQLRREMEAELAA